MIEVDRSATPNLTDDEVQKARTLLAFLRNPQHHEGYKIAQLALVLRNRERSGAECALDWASKFADACGIGIGPARQIKRGPEGDEAKGLTWVSRVA